MPIFDTMHAQRPRFLSPSAFVDGGANVFLGVVINQGSDEDTWVRIYKRTPQGVKSTVAEYRSIAGKEDGVCIYQSGADLHAFVVAHPADTDTNIQDMPPIRGVCVPYPAGHPQVGAAGVFISEDTGGTGVTPEQIREIIAGVNATLQDEVQRIVDNMKPKAIAALSEAQTTTTGNVDDALHQPTMDRVYETFSSNVPGFWPWLRRKVMGEAEAVKWEAEQAAKRATAAEKETSRGNRRKSNREG